MLGALMRKMTFHSLWLALVCLSCVGGEGTTCFQDDECDSPLICCHVGSPFTQGSCQAQDVCDELQGGTGGTPGTGGVSGGAGTGGAGAGGIGGFGGMGGAAGAGGGGGGG